MDLKKTLMNYLEEENSPSRDSRNSFPYYTKDGQWKTIGSTDYDDWVSGFWTGILWLSADLFNELDEDAFRATKCITPVFNKNFNIGFRYQYSWLPAYLYYSDQKLKKKTLHAAERLANCYDPNSGMICHQEDSLDSYISATDMIMCLPLLLWARNYSPQSKKYEEILRTTLRNADRRFLKKTGGVRHRLQFNPDDGEISKVDSPQGKNAGCWSRGLAWTVTGFIQAGISLNESQYVDKALSLVEYHRKNSYRLIPAYDYSVSRIKQPTLIDTSAAAILASGLLTLGIVRNENNYFQLGKRIVNRLINHHRQQPEDNGFIGGSCYDYPEGNGVNEASIWGDFYTFESLYMMEKQRLPLHLRWITQNKAVDAA